MPFQIPCWCGHHWLPTKNTAPLLVWTDLLWGSTPLQGVQEASDPCQRKPDPGHFTQTRPNGPVRHLCWVLHSNICEDNRLLRCKPAVISSCPHYHTAHRNRIQRWSEAVKTNHGEGRPIPDMSFVWEIPSFPFVFFSTHLRQNSEDCNGRRTKQNKSQGVVFIIVVWRGFPETEVEGSRRLRPWWFLRAVLAGMRKPLLLSDCFTSAPRVDMSTMPSF